MGKVNAWKILRRILALTGIFVVFYLLLILLPYVGNVYVSGETRANFSMDDFFSDYEIPERVMLVEAPQDAFFHRVNLISQAQEGIILTSFAIHDGVTTDIIIGGLLAAADRGVDVTILNNAGVGTKPSRHVRLLTAEENIDVYLWGRLNVFRPRYINTILHDKYMIVDNEFLILGGRNIGDKYYAPDGFAGNVSLDREVLVFNTDPGFDGAVMDARRYFESKTASGKSSLVVRRKNRDLEEQRLRYINKYLEFMDGFYAYQPFDYLVSTVPANRITLLFDPIGGAKKESVVAYNLMMLAKNSDTVVANSPYVVLTNRNFGFFSEMAAQIGNFTLLTNSLASTPNLPAFSAYYVSRQKFLDTGMVIYEFQSNTQSIHSKTYLFDDRLTAIGSFNINERSIRSDTETMLVIDSGQFQEIVADALGDLFAMSLQVGTDNRYVHNPDVEYIPASRGKRILYTTAGHLLRFLRFMF